MFFNVHINGGLVCFHTTICNRTCSHFGGWWFSDIFAILILRRRPPSLVTIQIPSKLQVDTVLHICIWLDSELGVWLFSIRAHHSMSESDVASRCSYMNAIRNWNPIQSILCCLCLATRFGFTIGYMTDSSFRTYCRSLLHMCMWIQMWIKFVSNVQSQSHYLQPNLNFRIRFIVRCALGGCVQFTIRSVSYFALNWYCLKFMIISHSEL